MALDTVAEVKNRLTIEEVVKPYVQLRKAGRSMVGLCPFHKEKTGSFHVSPERGTYHCFGCGEGGDIFSFIEKIEGLDFKGALKMLAEKAGVPLDYARGRPQDRDKRERLHEAMARAAQFYTAQLYTHDGHRKSIMAALEYAKGRGLKEETVKAWGLGYAPDAWRALLEHLLAQGFTTQELVAAGLIKEADGKSGTYYDRFRDRLMFPIRNVAGRVVAFTGRALSAEDQAKYLNSPETDLYHKSDILFGLDRAKDAIRTRGFALLVEGQMDLLHAHQAGFTNTVALSGTALTGKHLALLKRYSDKLMLVLDADRAGLNASDISVKLALSAEMLVKAVGLPQGKDPADLIDENKKKFFECIANAQSVERFFLSVLKETESNPHRLEQDIRKMVFPLIMSMRNPIAADRAMQSVASVLGVSVESVRESLVRLPRSGVVSVAPATMAGASPRPPSAVAVREAMLRAAVHAYPDCALAKRIKGEYARITGDEARLVGAPAESLIFEAERHFGETPAEDAADDLLRAFELAVVREAYQEAVRALRQAETAGNTEAMEGASAQCAKLSARLAALG